MAPQRPALHRYDTPIVVLLFAVAQAEVWLGWQDGGAGVAPHGDRLARAAILLITTLPLLARRRAPLIAVTVVCAGMWTQVVLVTPYVSFLGALLPMAITTFSAALHAPRWRWAALLPTFVTLGVLAARIPEERRQSEVLFGALVVSCTWLAGDVVRVRLASARRAEADASAALSLERGRIARELHDVIAHGVSVMGVQAGAARTLLERDDTVAARDAVLAIEEVARSSVEELARLLAVLRDDSGAPGTLEPQPGLSRLTGLVQQIRAAGLPVQLELEPVPPLPAGLDLVAYRVVQEALTNALRHSGAPTTVRMAATADAVDITVDSQAGLRTGVASTGQGLVGMRERVQLYGGAVTAGPRPDGGFRVAVRLPMPAHA